MIRWRWRVCALLCLLLFAAPAKALAADAEIRDGVEAAMEEAGLSEWQAALEALPEEVRALWGGDEIGVMVEAYALGEGAYLGESFLKGIPNLLLSALPDALRLTLRLLAVALLSGFLGALAHGGVEGIHDLAGFVCHCFAVGLALTGFLGLADTGREAIVRMSALIEQTFPALLVLLTAAGGLASAGIFQPAMALLSGGMAIAIENLVLPLILFGGAMAVLSNMTGRAQLGQLLNLSKSAVKWILGLLVTLYFAITTLQGMTAAAFDGVSVRTAKYALGKMIPLVGGMVSGTVDTVLGCAVLVKNAAGMAAILLAFGVVALPLLEIGAGIFACRIAAALSEPVADARIPKMLGALADVLSYLFAAVAALAVLFIITIGLLMRAGTLGL